jgi:5-(carboxyamino)imidazole ribonucleotide synthase
VGLLCTEFFIGKTKKNKPSGYQCEEFSIYINEFAPRPHNSGHVTLNACTVSQFDVLARILLNVPLNQPRITAPGYFCMANLLGDLWLSKESNEINLSALKDQQELVDLVLYGKKEARRQRKMGHLVTYASTPELALQSADRIKASLMLE